MRAGLGVGRHAGIARASDLLERVVAAQMNDVDRRVGDLGEGDGPMHSLRLGLRRAGERVIFRRRFPLGQRAFDDGIDHHAVLGVHADQPTVLAGSQHRLVDCRVIDQEDSRIGHEQLEAGHALSNHLFHFRQALVGKIGADQMETVVDRCFRFRLLEPDVEGLAERLTFVLNSKVDDGGRAAERRGARAGLEIVR